MPYQTIEELRKNPYLSDNVVESGGTRFEGSTHPPTALKYLPKNAPVLECGPVYGKFTEFLLESGYQDVHALDFYDVLRFVDRGKIKFNLIDFNTERMPYPDGYFGSVAAWGIGEHLENPFHFMREAHRVLENDKIFIFSIPNIFHIMSRLVFLKRGTFPRWGYRNNHIMLFPRGVFEKTFLRYFDLIETVYIRPAIHYPLLNKFSKFLPANQWFGNFVVYVLKKKPFVPFKYWQDKSE